MTQDIKAAIAGAIEALEAAEYWGLHQPEYSSAADVVEINKREYEINEALAALRRIEFVDTRQMKLNNSENSYADGVRTGWNMFADHLTTTGHAIVKMGDI